MKIEFTKMQGLGNDYIYIDCFENMPCVDFSELSLVMSERHFSVGADGIVLLLPSDVADIRMRMFNSDGSEGRMCGNALRCIVKLAYEKGIINKDTVTVETLSGIKKTHLNFDAENKVSSVTAYMGRASFDPRDVPVLSDREMINEKISVLNKDYFITCLSVGNPHSVTFVDSESELSSLALDVMGTHFEHHPLFPNRINTEFVYVTDECHLSMRVYERGSGETYACGTGACAVVSAAVRLGICKPETHIYVSLIGGTLDVLCHANYELEMTGPAVTSYTGIYDYGE